MLNKNNPFLLKNDTNRIFEEVIKNRKILDKIRFFPKSNGLVLLIESLINIVENGFTILEVKRDEFDSNISRKTIESMQIDKIQMPFKSFAIKFKNNNKESFIFVDNKEDSVIFSKEDSDGNLSCRIKKDESSIKENFLDFKEESIDMILDSISVIMYFTAFKNEKARVEPTKIPNKNGATKQISKTVSIIKINSSFYSNNRSKDANKISDKSWIVKGHWRNQPIGSKDNVEYKTIWIDSYWKGDGKEQINKIYKLN